LPILRGHLGSGRRQATREKIYMSKVSVSRKHQTLVVPRDGQTENMFPTATPVRLDDRGYADFTHLLVPHGIQETIMLRHLGYKVPNPGLCYYDFGALKPFHVQERTFDMMTTHPRSYV